MEKNLVFISYKNTDNGVITEDSRLADEIYAELCSLGIKTFYSNITLIETGSTLYKEAIEQALDESVVLILIGTSKAYIESTWVKYEWSNFHEDILADAKPNGTIVPYFSENIKRSEKPMPLRNLETFLIERHTASELAEFVMNYLRSKDLLYEDPSAAVHEMGIDEHSHYRVISADEKRMVNIQSQLSLETDLSVFSELLRQNDSGGTKYVLDVGCVEGITIKARMDRLTDIDLRVVGIDRDADVIETANKNNADDRYTFVTIEVDSDDFEEKMAEFMERENIPGFDLITLTLLLRHFKEPALAIKRLKRFLRTGGHIYIREQDDGSLVSYGDKGLINKIIDKHSSLTGVSDHYYGRKVYSQLMEAGYKNISTRSVIRDTVNKSREEKVDIFCAQFVKRRNFIEYLVSQNESDSVLRDTLDWFGIALDKLYEYFLQPDFYFAETDFIFWAEKPDDVD